ncbi:MAG: DUF4157 domain-containing protein [Chitinophagaceae bacterium]
MEDKKEEKVMKKEGKKEEEKVMRAEDKKEEEKVQRAEDKKEEEKVMKMEDKKEDEKIQKKEAGSPATSGKTVSNYIGSLNGKGQSLPAQSNHFFSSKMGYDFSGVKVHTDKEAAESAKAINAKAYTIGNNVVFNEGQYNTESIEGRKLMAHELMHVVQQNISQDNGILNRKTNFGGTTKSDVNMAEKFVESVKSGTGESYVGITTPYINGKDLTVQHSANPIVMPGIKDISATQNNGVWESTVTNIPTNSMTYSMHIPQKPSGSVWKVYVDSGDISSVTQCKGMINVYLKGVPGNEDVINNTETHEKVHASDLKNIHDTTLGALDKFFTKAKATDTTEEGSKTKLLERITNVTDTNLTIIIDQISDKAVKFHGTKPGAKAKMSITSKDPSCMWIKASVSS